MRKVSIPPVLRESSILEYIFISAFLLFFFSDAANKILLYKGADFKRISIIIRAAYELVFILIILLFANKSRFQFIILFLLWFLVFLSGQLLLAVRVKYHYNLMENINIFNKYMFVFIVYYALYRYYNFQERFGRLIKILEFLFVGNSFLIILGFIFNIEVFSTYVKNNSFSYRFGYSGLIPAQNEATMFLFIGICYFYYKYFVLKEMQGKWKFYLILISSILLGTKGIYLFLLLFFLYYVLVNTTPRQRITAAIIALLASFGIFILLQTDWMKFYMHYFSWNLEEKGLVSMLLSGRNAYIKYKFIEILSYWTPVNFFIGGQDQTRYLIEMDFFDAFLFFGLAGMIILIMLYFKTLFRFRLNNPFLLFFVFSFFLIAFFAGHFFTSAVNALYLCLVTLYFYQTQESRRLENENQKET